jgi:hypothetical protein
MNPGKTAAVAACLGGLCFLSCIQGHGLSPTTSSGQQAGIRGRITFVGSWPDSTKEVRIAVLKQYPKGMNDPDSILAFVLGNLAAFSDTIPRNSRTYDYTLNLEPDLYAWVLVAWFPDITVYLFGVKELGAYYSDPQDTEYPTPVQVIPGAMTDGIDIEADFVRVDSETPFYKQ